MKKLNIPSKAFFAKAKSIIIDEIIPEFPNPEFNNLRRSIYGNSKILKLIRDRGLTINEISSGVSDRKAYRGYIKQIIRDFKSDRYYRSYYPSKGNAEARAALAIYENYKFRGKGVYNEEDFCLSEGSTGAITIIFEYLKKYFPRGKVLIQSPNYYLYKFAANYYGIGLIEVAPMMDNSNYSFVNVDSLIAGMTDEVKMVILTNPANPSGEIYDRISLSRIMKAAKDKNIIVMADELFGELVFEPEKYVQTDVVAFADYALDNLVVIKGYSKSKNLVGLRVGYMFSKNKELIGAASLISQQRSSYSVASNFTGLIALDCFIQSSRQNPGIKIERIYKDFRGIKAISDKSLPELRTELNRYLKYFKSLMKYYSRTYDLAVKTLGDDVERKFAKNSAFNTIVKISGLDNVNSFDLMINFFLTTGVKTEIGPCFGFSQKTWDRKMGYWLRLTFAKEEKLFKDGLDKFKQFRKLYLKYPDRFLKTDLSF